jgi:hypothetical protein
LKKIWKPALPALCSVARYVNAQISTSRVL